MLIKEQYYIDLLKPEYNICKVADSRLVFTEKIVNTKQRHYCNLKVENLALKL